MTTQRFIRRATARRLIASTSVAPYVRRSTVLDERIEQPVMRCRAEAAAILAGIILTAGQHFYLVASKFSHRFYVVAKTAYGWQCSAKEAAIQQRCICLVRDYRRQLRARQAA